MSNKYIEVICSDVGSRNLGFIDDLKFRDRSNKKELNRDTLELISNYRGKTQFIHKCELSSLQNFKKKYSELIKGLSDIYKPMYENNKM